MKTILDHISKRRK